MSKLLARGLFDAATAGLVPASGGGTTTFLRADGSWAGAGGGGVTVADADYGDVTVSGTGTVWTVDGLAALQTSVTALLARGLFDTVLTPATITFGVAFDNWNVGTLGNVTLICYTTDGVPPGSTSRAVRGLAGGSVGKVVALLNMNPSGTTGEGQFQHLNGSASAGNQFRCKADTAVSGGAGGCVAFYHDGSFWRQIWST